MIPKSNKFIFQIPLSFTSKSFFATKMQASSTQKTKDSAGRRLGVKKFGGEEVFPDDIIIRQRGFRWHPGKNTFYGRDHTIHSKIEGKVKFELDPWRRKKLYRVNVEPNENVNRYVKPPPPICYHPELFPERAEFNPEPTKHQLNKKKQVTKKEIASKSSVVKANELFEKIKIPEHYLQMKDPWKVYQEGKEIKTD